MSAVVVAGIVVGTGLWFAWTGLRPAPEPLGVALARIDRRPVERPAPVEGVDERDIRIGRFLLRHIPVLARIVERAHADLRLVGRTPEEQAARVGVYAVVGLLLGPWVGLVMWMMGFDLPAFVPGTVTLGGVAWGVIAPFAGLRRETRSRRQAFALALSAWCDVTVMCLAAGRGVEQAVETAAASGRGWAFAELRGALRAGHVRGDPPWTALGRLGADLAIPDLAELGNTIAMAGEEGAAVRETVAAKARTIRERVTSESEVAAAGATERMSLPSVVLILGFLLFLCFPAVAVMFQIK